MGPGFATMPDFMGWMMLGSYVFWAVLLALGVFAVVRLAGPRTGAATLTRSSTSGSRAVTSTRRSTDRGLTS